MIEVKNLFFEYPGKLALRDVSLKISKGEVTALTGPNGAGKTTLLRGLAALHQPLSGSIRVAGIDVISNPRLCHEKVGYLADFFGLYEDLTVKQCLMYMARSHSITADGEPAAVNRASARLHIEDRLHQRAGTLSRGLSQRLAIAQAIIHEPAILMLDEPASGLDPEARSQLSDLFHELSTQGITLIISSHILAELEEYCTSMLIVDNGEIREHRHVSATPAKQCTIEITLSHEDDSLIKFLKTRPGISSLKTEEAGLSFVFSSEKAQQAELLQAIISHQFPICHFAERKTSLQDVYLAKVNTQESTT